MGFRGVVTWLGGVLPVVEVGNLWVSEECYLLLRLVICGFQRSGNLVRRSVTSC